jgi:hypothetical protein
VTAVMRRRSSLTLLGLLAATTLLSSGCHRHAASAADCASILDRLVEMELSESGYRDRVLRARWQEELERRFAPDLEHCRGLAVRDDLNKCLASARTSEEVTHRCLD